MARLATWLQQQLHERGLTQQAAAVYAGVSGATISGMINHGHLPRTEILFCLADYFDTPSDYVLRLAARMPLADEQSDQDELLIQELVDEFRRLPDDWKREVISMVDMFNRMASRPPYRVVGGEEGGDETQETP